MSNLLDKSVPLIFEIIIKLSQDVKNGSRILFKKRRYYKSMYELFQVLGGKTGRKQDIITDLKQFSIIKQDDNGIYYDLSESAKMIKSCKLVDCAKLHGLGDIFG